MPQEKTQVQGETGGKAVTENILDQLQKIKAEIRERYKVVTRLDLLMKDVDNAKTLQELEVAINNAREISKIRQFSILLDQKYAELYKLNDRIQ